MIRKLNKEDFVKRCNTIFNSFYTYELSDCSDWSSKWQKITVTCPKHGNFETTPFDHNKNRACCPICESEHSNPAKIPEFTKSFILKYINDTLTGNSLKIYLSRFSEVLEKSYVAVGLVGKMLRTTRLSNTLQVLNIQTVNLKSAECITFSEANRIREFVYEDFHKKRDKVLAKTISRKYGKDFTHNSQLAFVKQKKIESCLNHYGVDNPSKVKDIRKKAQNSTFERFGKFGGLGNQGERCYKFDGLNFDSSWELKYYLYQKYFLGKQITRGDVFQYIDSKGQNRSYECDFKLENVKNVEIKGDQFLAFPDKNCLDLVLTKSGKTLYDPYNKEFALSKAKCLKENFVDVLDSKDLENILTFIDKKYDIKLPHDSSNILRPFTLSIKDFVQSISNIKFELGKDSLDLFFPEKSLAICCDEIYWCSELKLLSETDLNIERLQYLAKMDLEKRRLNTTKSCEQKGIRLLHILDLDWNNPTKQSILKSIIASALGIYEKKYFARKLRFTEIDSKQGRAILEENHLQGAATASKYFALVDDQNNPIQVMSFQLHSNHKYDECELNRMVTLKNVQVLGGFSKLLKNSLKALNVTSCTSYIDRSVFDGKGYKAAGFVEIGETEPCYSYIFQNQIKRREFGMRKNIEKLFNAGILSYWNPDETERVNMLKNRIPRIWDCGKLKVGYKLS